jgi:hypothetical protein
MTSEIDWKRCGRSLSQNTTPVFKTGSEEDYEHPHRRLGSECARAE